MEKRKIYSPFVVYLVAAYRYYVTYDNDNPVEDHEFDALAKWLDTNWDEVNRDTYGKYVSRGDVKAGTFLGTYPDNIEELVESFDDKNYFVNRALNEGVGIEIEK